MVADNVEFLGSKNSGNTAPTGNNTVSSSTPEPTPYDFGNEEPQTTAVDSNPFADFGSTIEINDDELPF